MTLTFLSFSRTGAKCTLNVGTSWWCFTDVALTRDFLPTGPIAVGDMCVIGVTDSKVSVCLCNVDGTQSIGVVHFDTKNVISLHEINMATFHTVLDMLRSPHIWDAAGKPVPDFCVSMCTYSQD